MFTYNLDDLFDKNVVDEFENYLKTDTWLQGLPGGFVSNSPKRQVNAYGDGSCYDDCGNLVQIGLSKTYWTAKMSQGNITLVSKPKKLPDSFVNMIPTLRSTFKNDFDANITPNTFNIAVCNYYTQPDMHIAAHTDDNVWYPSECSKGPVFASITFYPHGTPTSLARFQIKKDGKWIDVPLKHRSLLIMPSGIEHRVLKYKQKDIPEFKPRINITFRSTYQRSDNILMNAMAISNHTRYYGIPSKLIIEQGMDQEVKNEVVSAYKAFCAKYGFDLQVSTYMGNKAEYRRKWIKAFRDKYDVDFKVMNNMVAEMFRMLVKSS